jgi:hypothetical protein
MKPLGRLNEGMQLKLAQAELANLKDLLTATGCLLDDALS